MNPSGRVDIGRRRGASSKPGLNFMAVAGSFFALSFVFACLLLYASFSSEFHGDSYLKGGPIHSRKYAVDQRRGDQTKGKNDIWDQILRAEVHLVSLSTNHASFSGSKYRAIKATFCRVRWDLYRKDPPAYPMYTHLAEKSGCGEGDEDNWVSVDLATAVKKAKEYDNEIEQQIKANQPNEIDGYVHSMTPTGFVFHESRVGSTLAANSLMAMNPDGHRVYSEGLPTNVALRACDGMGSDCDETQLFQDVVYLLGRTNDPNEKRSFFKISSIGSKYIRVFRKSFPSLPWIFIYRDPVQTMMSHLDPEKGKKKIKSAVCLRSKNDPPADLKRLVSASGRKMKSLSIEEFCAAHLASLCESALREMKESKTGKSVEYDGLVEKLIEDIIPNHFGVEVSTAARQKILDVSKVYSKSKNGIKDWEEDSAKKDTKATDEIRSASELFLRNSYTELSQYN